MKNKMPLYNRVILYTPLDSEVDYAHPLFPLMLSKNKILLPRDKNSDPFAWAAICTKKYKKDTPCILLPGIKFDMSGTRHGKGAGWYDRFLSKVPAEWPRIGIAHLSQMSANLLKREKWDQLMDWLIIYDGKSWSIEKTNARN